jgi:uncharacterized protein (DUF433 family)
LALLELGAAVEVALDIYQGRDPREVATYTIPMAAHYLRMATPTLRSWVIGYTYPTAAGATRAKPVISPPERKAGARVFLSFTNLVEAYMLSSIRRVHRVSLPTVRRSLKFIEDKFRTPHPLARERFRTDGVDLFVEKFGRLINLSNAGQVEMKQALEHGLTRIEYDHGFAERLFPLSRAREAVAVADQPRLIVIDPRLSFGRPVIAGTGVPISEISERFRAGDSVEHLAVDFRLDQEKVQEALRAAA